MTNSIGNQAMELADQLYRQEQPTVKQEKSISEDSLKVTAILWDKFTIGYQHLWANTYGVIGGPEYQNWAKALSTIEPRKVLAAVGRSIKECTEFPPNLVKFMRFCREDVTYPYTGAKMLPPPKREDPQAIERWRAEARRLGYLKKVQS